MGTEIIRRKTANGELIRTDDARRNMDLALAWIRSQGATKQRTSSQLSPYRSVAQDVVDIPRICAVHGAPYVARYVLNDGRYRLAQCIRFKTAVSDQYASETEFTSTVPGSDIGEENCPWCGAGGRGAVRCGTCKRLVCQGKVVGNYFKCHDSCGGRGPIELIDEPLGKGLNPSHNAKAGGYGA